MGTASIGFGNAFDNLISGNSGINILSAITKPNQSCIDSGDADTFIGGRGNDYYFVDSARDWNETQQVLKVWSAP